MKTTLCILIGLPLFVAAEIAGGVLYHPIFATVPGTCIGFIGWGRLLRDVTH